MCIVLGQICSCALSSVIPSRLDTGSTGGTQRAATSVHGSRTHYTRRHARTRQRDRRLRRTGRRRSTVKIERKEGKTGVVIRTSQLCACFFLLVVHALYLGLPLNPNLRNERAQSSIINRPGMPISSNVYCCRTVTCRIRRVQ